MSFKQNLQGKRFLLRKILLFSLLAPLIILAMGYVVMTLWNYTLSQIFAIQTITFWQAIGLLILSKIFFGGFRGGWRGRNPGNDSRWKQKWASMPEEERARYRQRWQQWCKTEAEVVNPNTTGEAR